MLSEKKLKNRLEKFKKSIHYGKSDSWIIIDSLEKFIADNKKSLIKYPDLAKQFGTEYLNVIMALSDNLGEISRDLFLKLDDIHSIKTDESVHETHKTCAYASEQLKIKIVDHILDNKNINYRSFVILRYLLVAKMRMEARDLQMAEFIILALSSPAVSITRLKHTYATLPSQAIDLIHSLEFLVIKPDAHLLKNRDKTTPIIPSLARIKKLLTYSNDPCVSAEKNNEIKVMISSIQSELGESQVHMVHPIIFFSPNEIKTRPAISQEDFDDHRYRKSTKKIEKRNKSLPISNLFSDDFINLLSFDFSLHVDKKTDALLKKHEIDRKLTLLHESILNQIEKLKTYSASLEQNKDMTDKKIVMDSLLKNISSLENTLKDHQMVNEINDLVLYLNKKSHLPIIEKCHLQHKEKEKNQHHSVIHLLHSLINQLLRLEKLQKLKKLYDAQYEKICQIHDKKETIAIKRRSRSKDSHRVKLDHQKNNLQRSCGFFFEKQPKHTGQTESKKETKHSHRKHLLTV